MQHVQRKRGESSTCHVRRFSLQPGEPGKSCHDKSSHPLHRQTRLRIRPCVRDVRHRTFRMLCNFGPAEDDMTALRLWRFKDLCHPQSLVSYCPVGRPSNTPCPDLFAPTDHGWHKIHGIILIPSTPVEPPESGPEGHRWNAQNAGTIQVRCKTGF